MLETYDFKLTSKAEKLDIRLKFSEGKPKIVTVKKFEYKVAIFDVLCFNRYFLIQRNIIYYRIIPRLSNLILVHIFRCLLNVALACAGRITL